MVRILAWLKRGWLLIVLITIFLFLQYKLWFSSSGVEQIDKLKAHLKSKQAVVNKAKQRNKELFDKVQHIKNSSEEIEAHARYDLGMVKSGEEFMQIVTPSNQENNSTKASENNNSG